MHSVKSFVFTVSVLAAGASAKPLDLGPLNEASLGPLDELPSATPSVDLGLLSDLPAPTGAPNVGSLDLPLPTQLPDVTSLKLPAPSGLPDLGSLDLPVPTKLPDLSNPANDLDLGFLDAPQGASGATIGVPMMINYAAPVVGNPATIILHKGTGKKQQNMGTLTSTAKGGFYMWTPAKTLPAGKDYALEIQQGDHTNMSPLFSLKSLSLPSVALPLASPLTGALGQATKLPLPSPGLLDSNSFKTTPVRAPLPKVQAVATGAPKPLRNSTNNATPTLSKTYVPTAAAISPASPSPSEGAATQMGSSAITLIGGLAAALVFLI